MRPWLTNTRKSWPQFCVGGAGKRRCTAVTAPWSSNNSELKNPPSSRASGSSEKFVGFIDKELVCESFAKQDIPPIKLI